MTPAEVVQVLGLAETATTKRTVQGQTPAVRRGAEGFRVKASVLEKFTDDLPEV
jgi:hypothetical protein